MTCKDSNGRECEVEVEHASDPCDSFAMSGAYLDVPFRQEVPEEELNWITDAYAERLAEEHFEWSVGRAEACFEGDR